MTQTTPAGAGPGAPSADEVIRTERLTKVYPGDIRAVDALDLSVYRGEIFGLLGPNGAGKTTTAGMLTTRVVPTEGKAYVGGVDVWARPAEAKRLIGVVPQSNTLDRSLTVRENLVFHGRFFGMSPKKAGTVADQLLEQFRLTERGKAPVLALSGGMAQRLMVARAVMHRPSVLFLDEPTAGLDPQSRIALWGILGELHDEGQTILLTTHYMEEADQLCDRLAIIDHGRVLALGHPSELKASTGIDSIVTVAATGDLHALADLLAREIPGATGAPVHEGTIRLGVKGTEGVLPAVVNTASRHRVLAPLPVDLVAVEKIVAGALQCLIAALMVFPIAYLVPATPVNLQFNWPVLLTFVPLACISAAALGLMFGTLFDPRTVPLLFGIIVVPLTFLGCIYFPWKALEAIRWLQIAVLANPLVYISEGFRAALTPAEHMSLWAVYPVLFAFTAFFTWRGLHDFKKRVLS